MSVIWLIRPRPEVAIRVIAGLWFLQGINAAFGMGAALVNRQLHLDFTVLGLWLGQALWQHKPRAWGFAVACTWLTIAMLALAGVLLLTVFPTRLPVTFFGQPVGFTSIWPFVWGTVVLLLLACWELWTLGRQDVRSLFKPDPSNGVPAAV